MTDTPALTRDLLDILLDDLPTWGDSLSMTIDETVSAIQSLHPEEWRDHGLHPPTDYSAGIDQETLGLYDLALSAWDGLKRTVRDDWVMDWGDEAADDGKEFLTGSR